AGHDRFSPDLMGYAMPRFRSQIPVPFPEIMALGRVNPKDDKEPFCMTVLALKLSRAANGVSELHGDVSRHVGANLYPGVPVEKVPIGHITNGIHLIGWMKGTVRPFWQHKVAVSAGSDVVPSDWATRINTPEFWARLADPEFITDEELWAVRYK